MLRIVLLLTTLYFCAAGQTNRWFDFAPRLTAYLQLTDAQQTAIATNNDAYYSWLIEKSQRMSQVHREIANETSKEVIDPMELGIRYLEIEGACRQIVSRRTDVQKSNSAVLTDAQRTKLKALEDALALVPVIVQAQQTSLLGEPQVAVIGTTVPAADRFSRTDGTRLGSSVSGCGGGLTAAVIGDPFPPVP